MHGLPCERKIDGIFWVNREWGRWGGWERAGNGGWDQAPLLKGDPSVLQKVELCGKLWEGCRWNRG